MTRPRPCAGCGVNPVAYAGREFCYDCVPRTWKKPPRCKLCGSTEDYYTNGRCRRCHRSAHLVGSCLDCLAWGVTRHFGWLCEACLAWRRRFTEPRECASCSRVITVNARGYCRLCTRQASLVRLPHYSIDVAEACQHGQQLYFAGMFRQKRPEPQPRPQQRLPWPGQYPVHHRQLVLFDAERDLAAGRRAGFPSPPLPGLAAALEDVLADHAARHGWGRQLQAVTRSALRVLLATQDTPGASVPATDVEALTQLAFNNVRAVTEILAAAGVLEEDRESALDAWFTRRGAGLPEPMAEEFRSWFEALRDGSRTPPRLRPRSTATIRIHVARAAPILHTWAGEGHQSLREITRQDILGTLPAQANQHRQALSALRSLFRFLKGRRVIFADPAARLRHDRLHNGQPLPLNLDTVREAIHSGHPARAALAALVAFHALRSGQLASLELTDVRDGRLHLGGRVIPLAAPVRERLAAWLDERARGWPATVNPHLFINWYTAVRETPVSSLWISHTLGISPQAVREDRILDEALATGGDIRRLCDLFGLTVGGAVRYTGSAGTDR
jgi:hypothetical protein